MNPQESDAYVDQILAWRQEKDESLRGRDGWLALAGLHWLIEGTQSAGAGDEVDLRLPASMPRSVGTFEVRHSLVFFHRDPSLETPLEGEPSAGEPLRSDVDDHPGFLRLGAVTVAVIERAGRLGLRVWDNARPERTTFVGRTWYPVDLAWSVQARFEPATAGRRILVPNQIGDLNEETLLGTASFTINGAEAALHAVPNEDGKLWFLFADATNGRTTYPSGRFLVADLPEDGLTTLDFNRAYNPPCAFTPYATCPLPPKGNQLAMAIEAGESYGSEEPRTAHRTPRRGG